MASDWSLSFTIITILLPATALVLMESDLHYHVIKKAQCSQGPPWMSITDPDIHHRHRPQTPPPTRGVPGVHLGTRDVK